MLCHQIKWHNTEDIRSEVDVDVWWRAIDSKLLEGVIFRSSTVEPIFADEIAPWLPPSCRGRVINTEHLKKSNKDTTTGVPVGCPKKLAELIRKGVYDPLKISSFSATQLQEVCSQVGIKTNGSTTKV